MLNQSIAHPLTQILQLQLSKLIIIKMQQKLASPICTISNIRFEVMHKGKHVLPAGSLQKNRIITSANKTKGSKTYMQGFIPTNFNLCRKQLSNSLKVLKKDVKPLKGMDIQHRGFPVRKIRTSQSMRSIITKKEKNFIMGECETPIFSNPRLSQLLKTELRQKQTILPQYMSKSALQNYTSVKSINSSRQRRSIY